MKKFRTFICTECKHTQSNLVSDETTVKECEECKAPAKLTISTPKYFGNSTGRSPSAVN